MSNAKRSVGLVAAICALVAPTTASAAKNHSVNITATLALVQAAPTRVAAGPLTGFGHDGLLITRSVITGTTFAWHATRLQHGRKRDREVHPRPYGRAGRIGDVHRNRHLTGGTGRYQGATGRLTIDGSAMGAVTTFHARGTLKY